MKKVDKKLLEKYREYQLHQIERSCHPKHIINQFPVYITRQCPVCNHIISAIEVCECFVRINSKFSNDDLEKAFQEIWRNENIHLLCCTCIDIFTDLTDAIRSICWKTDGSRALVEDAFDSGSFLHHTKEQVEDVAIYMKELGYIDRVDLSIISRAMKKIDFLVEHDGYYRLRRKLHSFGRKRKYEPIKR